MAEAAIIGLGFVGGAMFKSFTEKGVNVYGYDKYKDGGLGNIEPCLNAEMIFLCLPTLFNTETQEYDKSAINEVISYLKLHNYSGIIIVKSTVEPNTVEQLAAKYRLRLIHNPEFLTARTAYHDFHNQKHVVLGKSTTTLGSDITHITKFYKEYYPNAEISICSSSESECMKIFVNSFYASKIQLFNEFYLLSKDINVNFNTIKKLMLKNKWINPRHTNVPGPDGKLSFGGACFPKDTSALLYFMKEKGTPHKVLNSVVEERNSMRDD